MAKRQKQLRYVEISQRNPITRIRVGSGGGCNHGSVCDDVCIEIRRAGHENCHPEVSCPDNPCECHTCSCNKCHSGSCDPCTFVANVCALEVDDAGYAVFEWPDYLKEQKEGWYEGYVMTGCSCCGVFPVRIGPRCNVIEVETVISGPDSKCTVGCEEECRDGACHPKYGSGSKVSGEIYVPDYQLY